MLKPVNHMTRHEFTLEKAQQGLMGRPQLVIKTIWMKAHMNPQCRGHDYK